VNTGVEYDNRHFQAARIGILFQPTNAIENYFHRKLSGLQ